MDIKELESKYEDIKGFPNYKISSNGAVISKGRKYRNGKNYLSYRVLDETTIFIKTDKDGYKFCCLMKNGKKYYRKIHRLVACAFIENPKNKPQVNHIDGVKENNNISNLEWVTQKENMEHALKHGLIKKSSESVFAKRILQYDLKNNLIKAYNSVVECAKELNLNKCCISLCACGKQKTSGGFIWRYENS